MVGVEDENSIHRPRQHVVDDVLLGWHRKHHVQEILRVIEVIARIDKGLADRILVGHRGNRRDFCDQSVRSDHPLVRVGNVRTVVIEG